jgi:aspartate/methionine/tyrosine aminotransferase
MDVVARASELSAAGEDVVMMCVGQPSAQAPFAAREAARERIANGPIGYTSSGGIEALRRRISQHCRERYGVDLDPARVVVTTGSSAGFMLAFLALFENGERVAIPSPGYPAYRNILKALSLQVSEIETTASDRWVLTADALEKAHGDNPISGILIANPNNPNGTMMKPDAFEHLLKRAEDLGIAFISDEIYHGLTYDMPEKSALEFTDDAIVINSFSKYFCMTGWRIGWMVVPEGLIETITRLHQNLFISAPEVSQVAALYAFDGLEELDEVRNGYLQNRDFLLDALPRLGIRDIQPVDGAFYAYANVSALTNDSEAFCKDVLESMKTALTPGTDFDTSRGRQWVRFSFAGSNEAIREGVERLSRYLDSRG